MSELSAADQTEAGAFEKFAQLIHAKTDYRTMADRFLCGCPEYAFYVNREHRFEVYSDSISLFFDNILLPSLFLAYREQKNMDTIARVYAFVDWAMWHDFGTEEENSEFWTFLLFCFF